ncbi:MAG TPA: hypothetical protein VHT30_09300 [Acidimicrobiales bacterium]|nr:hypothetical protein [Acidimicrobiales bacterium]
MAADLPGVDDAPEGSGELKKSWVGEAILAVLVLAATIVAASTSGLVRLVFVVVAIAAGLLLLWSLMILILLERVVGIIDRIKRSDNGDRR